MKLSSISILLLILLSTIFFACSPIYYSPSNAVSPDLEERGDIMLSANKINSDSKGSSFGLAVSPIDHLGLLLRRENHSSNYEKLVETGNYSTYGIPYYKTIKHKFTSNLNTIGGGYYRQLSERTQFQLYSTYGVGSFIEGGLNGDITKIGVHTTISFAIMKFAFDFNGSLNKLNYKHVSYGFDNSKIIQKEYLQDQNQHLIREFFFTGKLKLHSLNLYCQLGFSKNITNRNFTQSETNATIGVAINISRLFEANEN